MATISSQLMKAMKDPVSYGKFIGGNQDNPIIMGASNGINVINDRNSEKSLKAIQSLLRAQIASQGTPIQFVKNDFKREKINHKEIENRIRNTNNISKELNRVAEDFRATLFNITNIREFDEKIKALMQNDINELLNVQRELTLAEAQNEFSGNSIKKISYIQEKMYKVMEKIQHHFVVQQDIRKKEQKQNIIINAGGAGISNASARATAGGQSAGGAGFGGNGFLDSLFQYLGIRRVVANAHKAGVAAGAATAAAVKNAEKTAAKNAASLRRFLKAHPYLSKLSASGFSLGKTAKLGGITSLIVATCVYGVASLDEAEYGSLLNRVGKSLNNIAGFVRESFFGTTGNSMKDFYENSHFMSGGTVSLDHPMRALQSYLINEAGFRLAQAGSWVSAGAKYATNAVGYGFGKLYDKVIGDPLKKFGRYRSTRDLVRKLDAELKKLNTSSGRLNVLKDTLSARISGLQKNISDANVLRDYIAGKKGNTTQVGGRIKRVNKVKSIVDNKIRSLQEQIKNIDAEKTVLEQRLSRTQNKINMLNGQKAKLDRFVNNLKPREKIAFQRNVVLRQMSGKISVFGVVVGGALAIEDIVNFFSVDIDEKIKHSVSILMRDRKKFKVSDERWRDICEEIISNMKSARKWWMATIVESISLSAINVGVGAGTFGVGLLVSVFVSAVVDALFRWVRDWWLGFDFDLIDFDNPYTFISQKKLVEYTSVSFLVTGSGIDITNLKQEFVKSSNEAAMSLSGRNLIMTKNGLITKFKEFDENITVSEHWWSSVKVSVTNAVLIACFISFMCGRNIGYSKYTNEKIDSSHTVGEIYDQVSNNKSEKGLYYPLVNNGVSGDIWSPYGGGKPEDLRDVIINPSNNNYLNNIVSSLAYLWSVACLFQTKKNLMVKNELSACLKDSVAQHAGTFNNNTLAYEFTCLWGIVARNEKEYHKYLKDKQFLNQAISSILSMLDDPGVMSSGIRSDVSNIIKHYTLAYLVYLEYLKSTGSSDENTLSIRFCTGNNGNTNQDVAIGKLKLIVTVLRSEDDWRKIWSFYKEKINDILTRLNSTSNPIKFDGSDLSKGLQISNSSSFKTADETKAISFNNLNQSLSNVVSSFNIGDYNIGGEGSGIDSITLASNNDERKLVTAALINQEIIKNLVGNDKYQNPNANINVARIVLDYWDQMKLAYRLNPGLAIKSYGFKEFPTNETVQDILKNYPAVYKSLLRDQDNENAIKDLYERPSNNISEDIVKGVYKRIKYVTINTHFNEVEDVYLKPEAPGRYFKVWNRLVDPNLRNETLTYKGINLGQPRVTSDASDGRGGQGEANTALKSVNSLSQSSTLGAFDVLAAVKNIHSTKKGPPKKGEVRYCAKHVRIALQAGGIARGLSGDANEYSRVDANGKMKLESYGFYRINPDDGLEPGDVAVITPNSRHTIGHVEMWDGSRWYSDYEQPRPWGPYAGDPSGVEKDQEIFVFRYGGPRVMGGLITKSQPMSLAPRNKGVRVNTDIAKKHVMVAKSNVSYEASVPNPIAQNVVSTPSVAQQPTQADMESDRVKNDDGVADVLFINSIKNDMIFGSVYCI